MNEYHSHDIVYSGTSGGTSAMCSMWDGQCQWLINQLLIDSNGITPLEITSLIC